MIKTIQCRSKKGSTNCPYHGKVYDTPNFDRVCQSLSKAYSEYSAASTSLKKELAEADPAKQNASYLQMHQKSLELWEAEDLHDSTTEGYLSLQDKLTKEEAKTPPSYHVARLQNRVTRANLVREVLESSEQRLVEIRNKIEASKLSTRSQKLGQLKQAIVIEKANIESEKIVYKMKHSALLSSQTSEDSKKIEAVKRNLLSYAIVQKRLDDFDKKVSS